MKISPIQIPPAETPPPLASVTTMITIPKQVMIVANTRVTAR